MAQALPVVKLAALFVRTLAKPVANKMKKEAANHPLFSSACVYCGQKIHYFSSRANVLALGYKFVGVKPLPDEEALAKGANFLSEVFIFTVAGIVMTLEVWRSDYQSSVKAAAAKVKEDEKNKLLDERFQELINDIDDIKESLPIESRKKYERIKKLRSGELMPPELEPEPETQPQLQSQLQLQSTNQNHLNNNNNNNNNNININASNSFILEWISSWFR